VCRLRRRDRPPARAAALRLGVVGSEHGLEDELHADLLAEPPYVGAVAVEHGELVIELIQWQQERVPAVGERRDVTQRDLMICAASPIIARL
jgi:hypothetical protein